MKDSKRHLLIFYTSDGKTGSFIFEVPEDSGEGIVHIPVPRVYRIVLRRRPPIVD